MKKSIFTGTRTLKILTHIGALLPLLLIAQKYFSNDLGINPIETLTLRTGIAALTILILSLAISPLSSIFGWKKIIPLRRLLGLYAAFYATLHFFVFIGLDYGFDWTLLQDAIFEKRYALIGFAAFVILLALTFTSNRWAMRKLGKRWKILHRLVYLAGVLAMFHFVWLVRSDYNRPIIYGVILLILLTLRWKPLKRRVSARRQIRAKVSPL